ncbi:hypothetical protein H0920_10565 [Acinetobacter sp. C_4_1]|uniref:hypothetical protein n=1 Tax=unclassified Acinetobacter TaxID=196816 RepID=UPI0021B7A8BF|nr:MULTISPECIES: hypothetical protein [unclassified Acinetobacter]MCT8090730.1 hypothetical protein [Acinetobacter sp. F_3_1]MCT8101538.1 hypothetical protein [Acinetobacter sp. C_4_1]MCT8135127.1 hypothetical protein [Acinetobacter sp. T_3_1]
MPILLWIWNNKRWTLIIVLLLCLFFQTWQSNSLAGDLRKAEIACDTRVDKAIKPYQAAIKIAKEQKAITEKAWSDKYIEVEQNAIKKIQDANAAARSADLAASGLSKQLSEANKRLSTASDQTIIEYTITNSELLESCAAEYRSMAEKADGHAIDVERISEVWPEDKALK